MPDQKKLTESVTRASKEALASDTGQIVVGAIADKMQEMAQGKAENVSQTIKEQAAKAAGRTPPSRKRSSPTEKEPAGPSAMSEVKQKTGDAVSAVGAGPKKVASGAKKVGKKAAGAVAENPAPLLAATSAAALAYGGAALARERKKKKSSSKRSSSKKSPAKKSSAKKSPAKKSPAKKSPAKKSPAKKSPAKKSPAKKSSAKKGSARKSPARS